MTALQPNRKEKRGSAILALIASALWFYIDYRYDVGIDIIYGRYGAVLFGLMAGFVGAMKRRSFWAWFAVGLWLVLLGVLIALFVSKMAKAICPECREAVDPEAARCPHCQQAIRPVLPGHAPSGSPQLKPRA